jgi:C-terminal processing protease CtpA/Prc
VAGIERDDELIAIDGQPAGALGLEAIRARLRTAGQRIRIELRRRDQPRAVELVTRRLI